ncbi:hypothetical protein PV326_001614, partial [Microctonus aethiopoides]
MFSTTLAVMVVLAVSEFGPVLGRNLAQNYNAQDEQYPIELLPENEYLIVSPEITPQILLTQPKNYNQDELIIQPEILVIVDFDLYSRFGRDWRLIFPYIITFWNAVDLKFRTLHSPSYRLNIAGIVIAETRDALSYIDGFKFLHNEKDYVSVRNSLYASSHWLYENRDKFTEWPDYDMAVTMTSNLLCNHDENEISESCSETTLGITYQARACHDNHDDGKTYKTAIIHNEGAYDRVLAAAHTISLLMGTSCDSPQCHDSDEYVMADVSQMTSSKWTADQVNFLQNFIKNSENFYCLTNQPQRGRKLETYLPGRIMDANEQCERMNFAGIGNIDPSICTQLKCVPLDGSWNDDVLGIEAADGTECGHNQICLYSQCVSKRRMSFNDFQMDTNVKQLAALIPSLNNYIKVKAYNEYKRSLLNKYSKDINRNSKSMFSTKLIISVVFVATIFIVPALARYSPEELENNYNTRPKLELLPQNEYLIGEETPVYFLRNASGQLNVYPYKINDLLTQQQRKVFDKAATSNIALSPEEQTYTSEQSSTSHQYTLNPEILVIVDYDLISHLNGNWESIISYIVTFWNAVDLKFRSVDNVTYRLNIAGIIVAMTPDALSYINDFKVWNSMDLDAKNSLDASAAWLYKNQDKFSLSGYDIAVTMTSNLLCKQVENERSGYCEEKTFGVTYQARACHDNHSDRKTYKTAIIHHEGAYDRVLAAAHTISLLMSTRCHSPRCNDPDEYIFADVPHIITSSDWSKDQLTSFFNFYGDIYKSYCLANDPERGRKLPTYLPGRIMNADEQCQKIGYSGAYKIDASLCKEFTCSYSYQDKNPYYLEYEAPDGTECGNEKMCLHSKC